MPEMYEWRDPARDAEDARFVGACRDAHRNEQRAWTRCDEERKRLHAALREARATISEREADR